MIKGNIISLIPAELGDRHSIYEWCYQSDITKSHAGPPDYPENPIPTYEEFYESDDGGYTEYYFTGARPHDGRGFLIMNDSGPVGFISYCCFHLKPGLAELDLWMSCEANCGKGFGTDALIALGNFLHNSMGVDELIIAPSIKNKRAIRSYEKAGFARTNKAMSEFLLDEYVDIFGGGGYGADGTAILVKCFPKK